MGIIEIAAPSAIRFQLGLKYFTLGYSQNIYPHPDYRYLAPPPKASGANYSYLAIPLNMNYLLPFISGVYFSGGIESVHVISGNSYTVSADGEIYEYELQSDKDNQFFMYKFGVGIDYKLDVLTLFIEPEYSHIIENGAFSPAMIREQISVYFGIKY